MGHLNRRDMDSHTQIVWRRNHVERLNPHINQEIRSWPIFLKNRSRYRRLARISAPLRWPWPGGAQVLVHYSNSEKEATPSSPKSARPGPRREGRCRPAAGGRSAHSGQAGPRHCRRPLDILVANAGISKAGSLEDTRIEDVGQPLRRERPRAVLLGSRCCRPCARAAARGAAVIACGARFRWRAIAYAATRVPIIPGQAISPQLSASAVSASMPSLPAVVETDMSGLHQDRGRPRSHAPACKR